jgi:hypothetical protein
MSIVADNWGLFPQIETVLWIDGVAVGVPLQEAFWSLKAYRGF